MNTLTSPQLDAVKAAIDSRDRQLRDELHAELVQSGNQRFIELAGSVHDQGDESVADELIDIENALIQRHTRELRDLDRARTRLNDGQIDVCIDCGCEIGYKRLLANPAAVRCIECQARFEKTRAHEATPRM